MVNTFNQLHLDGIRRVLPDSVEAKRSREFTKAIVIGRADKAGAIMISQAGEDLDYQWLVHHYPEDDPKSVSDDKVAWIRSYEHRFSYWNDVLRYITKQCESGLTVIE